MDRFQLMKIKRTMLGLTQTEMAKRVYFSRQQLSNIEGGKYAGERSIVWYEETLDNMISEHKYADEYICALAILECIA